jgi:hypothetical protein
MFILGMRSPPRCAYCHEALTAGLICTRCRAALHADCRAELGRCPSLGCGCDVFEAHDGTWSLVLPTERAIRAIIANARFEALSIAIIATMVCVFFFGAIAASMATDHVAKHGRLVRGSPAAATAWAVAGTITASATIAIQVLYAQRVRRILLETKPRRVTLRVTTKKQQVKGGTITVHEGSVYEGGRRTMVLSLGQDAGWLAAWSVARPIGLYGAGFGEPAILIDGDRSRVVRNFNIARA